MSASGIAPVLHVTRRARRPHVRLDAPSAPRRREGYVIAHARLDRRLTRLAQRPERYAEELQRLCVACDARGFALELADTHAWRGPASAVRVTVDNQFRSEVESVRVMGREEEQRLARRLEFARLRWQRALERDGLAPGDPLAAAAPVVARRRLEWRALQLEMVERNLYLVLINVERYRHTSAERADMIQAGAAVLSRAVDGFDWRRGLLFRTYAVHWLKEGFRSHLYNHSRTVRVPVYLQKALKHIHAATQRLGDPQASVEEIAREAGLRRSLVASARASARPTRSLDAPLFGSGGARCLASELPLREDALPAVLSQDEGSLQAGLEAALGKLNERERTVVQMRFGIGYARTHIYSEVATELGVSLERVRQILVRAMAKMRTPRLREVLGLLS